MNSQVRNTLTALTISSALLLVLAVAAPAVFPPTTMVAALPAAASNAHAARLAEGAVIATLSAEAPVVAGLAITFQDTATAPAEAKPARRRSAKSSRMRQSMAMPFFSFARG